jgi:hypothetical protein
MDHEDFIYIYSPPWVDWSAGIRVLHYLCDLLNLGGYQAFMVLHGRENQQEVSANLRTPVLTKRLLQMHHQKKGKIVAIYPEGIPGNPLNAQFVIRWILNFPSLLGGSETFENETVLAYSQTLSDSLADNLVSEILFIPALKTGDFNSRKDELSRPTELMKTQYELIYAQKYRTLGGILPSLLPNQIEIKRFGKDATSREETLNLICGAKLVHVYENTTVITEALVCGVPVLCHENPNFTELIADRELPMIGISWDRANLVDADADFNFQTLKNAENMASAKVLDIFADLFLTPQVCVSRIDIRLPRRGTVTKHSLARARVLIRQKGLRTLLRFIRNYLIR